MNKEEILFNTNEDIIMQIEMNSYMEYNDTIASMNDHLGEIYEYSDVENVENAQIQYEKELAYKAIEQLQKENKELKEIINKIKDLMDKDQCVEYCYRDVDNYLLELEKGDSNDI